MNKGVKEKVIMKENWDDSSSEEDVIEIASPKTTVLPVVKKELHVMKPAMPLETKQELPKVKNKVKENYIYEEENDGDDDDEFEYELVKMDKKMGLHVRL
jgi:hypothetical protein